MSPHTTNSSSANHVDDHEMDEVASVLRRDPRLKAGLREFLAVDNWTNFLYIGRAYLIAGLALGGAVCFFELRAEWGIPSWVVFPVYFVAILVIGATQHQLAGATHEAVHNLLFRNRMLNELGSDWLCAFPILTSTYQFRLYHLAHHQFVNDPERDPDFAMLKASGHWMDFPVTKTNFLWMMLRQVLLVDLFRYIVARLRFNTLGNTDNSPYRPGEGKKKFPSMLVLAQCLFVIGAVFSIQKWGAPWQLLAVPLAAWAVVATVLLTLPERFFETSRIKLPFHQRWGYTGLILSFTGIVSCLAYVQATSGVMVLRYFSLLWYGSLLTTFPFFMILRQLVQHGNGDRGFLTNTRVFRMNPFVRYAVFPFGMDYHLPHHMYASVPHFRLKKLHRFLMTFEPYRKHCREVDNYFVPARKNPRNPTVAEVLGPEYAVHTKAVHIDDSVLDGLELEGRTEADPSREEKVEFAGGGKGGE